MSELKKKVDLSTYAIQQNTQDSILKMQKEMNLELAASQLKSQGSIAEIKQELQSSQDSIAEIKQELQSTNLELKRQLAATTKMLREFETKVEQQHAEIMQKLNHPSS
jgi:hypothetical protein